MSSSKPSGGVCQLEHVAGIYVYVAFLILLAVVSTIENLLVVIAICKYKTLQKPSFILLGVLAFIDLITGCIVAPLKIWLTLVTDTYYHFTAVMVFVFLFMAVILFSVSTVLMISIDRFCQVYFLERYKLTKKKLILGVFISWIVPLAVLIFVAARLLHIGVLILGVAFFLLCIIGMVASYIAMAVALYKHSLNANDASRHALLEEQRNAIKTTLLIIATCILLNFPPVLALGLSVAGLFSKAMCAITLFALLANSAVNPLIYCIRTPVMKKHILMLLRRQRFQENEDPWATLVTDAANEMDPL